MPTKNPAIAPLIKPSINNEIMSNTIPNTQPNVNGSTGENMGIPNDPNTAETRDTTSDPSIFLAHQILEIKSEMEAFKAEVQDMIKQEIASIREDIKSALNE